MGCRAVSGYLLGAENDTASADFSREAGQERDRRVTGSYRRTAGLNGNGVTNGKICGGAGLQAAGQGLQRLRGLHALDQSSSSTLSINASAADADYRIRASGIRRGEFISSIES